MKKIPIMICLAWVLCHSLYAQKDSTDLAAVLPPKGYRLGLNTQFGLDAIFSDDNSGPLELMLRRQQGSKSAWRARLLIDLNTWEQQGFIETPPFEDINNRIGWGLALGKEWQIPLRKRWYGYLGLDIEGRGEKVRIHDDNYDVENLEDAEFVSVRRDMEVTQSFAAGILPFVGAGFQISDRLSLSTEIRLNISQRWACTKKSYAVRPFRVAGKDTLLDPLPPFSPGTPIGTDVYVREFAFVFRPYTGIFINYRF
jgi:hypothetical protein